MNDFLWSGLVDLTSDGGAGGDVYATSFAAAKTAILARAFTQSAADKTTLGNLITASSAAVITEAAKAPGARLAWYRNNNGYAYDNV